MKNRLVPTALIVLAQPALADGAPGIFLAALFWVTIPVVLAFFIIKFMIQKREQ